MVGNDLSYSYVSFGLKNPQSAMLRAEKLKNSFAKNGFNYVMPKDVWSDKKIEENLMTVNKFMKHFLKTNTLCEETVQSAVNHILPKEARNSIVVKDVSKIEACMLRKGYSQEDVKAFKNMEGLMVPAYNGQPVEIFMKFDKAKGSDYDKKSFISTTIHELQHALKSKFQNSLENDCFKNSKLTDEKKIDTILFHKFEEKYYPYFTSNVPVSDLSDKSFYKELKVANRNELYQKFDKTLKEIELENSKSFNEYIENKTFGKYSKKDFFDFMKNNANNEKSSYCIQTKLKSPEEYTTYDFAGRLYSEMARFFAELKNKAKF